MRVMITGIGEVQLAVRQGEERGVMCSGMRWAGRKLGGDIEGEGMVMSGDVRCLDERGLLRFLLQYLIRNTWLDIITTR